MIMKKAPPRPRGSDDRMHQVDRTADTIAERVAEVFLDLREDRLAAAIALRKAAEMLVSRSPHAAPQPPIVLRRLGLEARDEEPQPCVHRAHVAEPCDPR